MAGFDSWFVFNLQLLDKLRNFRVNKIDRFNGRI